MQDKEQVHEIHWVIEIYAARDLSKGEHNERQVHKWYALGSIT